MTVYQATDRAQFKTILGQSSEKEFTLPADRPPLEDPFEVPPPKRPYLLVIALVLAVAAIVLLAVINLRGGGEAARAPVQPGSAATPSAVTAPQVPSFDVVRISRGGTGVLAGRAAPDSLVRLLVDSRPVSDVRADRNGEWVMILEEPLAPGTVELSLTAQRDGEPAIGSKDVVVVSLPDRPQSERFAEPASEGVVAVLTPRDGSGGSRVMQKPGYAAPGEVGDSLAVDTIDYGGNGRTVFSGRALPRSTLRVYLDTAFIGETRADDDGRWQIASERTLEEGQHSLRIDQVISDGKVMLRITQPFTAGQALDPSAAQNRVIVQPGNTLWAIARQLYGRGVRYTLIFQENSEQIADPDLIYPGQVFRLPEAAKSDGGEAGNRGD
ncbi:MAG: LysM peptidoglycan-binding domain-containing protein [Alphaproteobacteria bacterium]|nr:MAG: LysM peptidoglycan-binding domain-containing protein [Alphaproteobacteria bacterium]